jgi:dolichol-phosphate mannosyltransferase
MAESERDVRSATIEGEYFDSVVALEHDFNPFADRAWRTLRKQFKRRVAHTLAPPDAGSEVLRRAGSPPDFTTAPKPRLLEVGCGTGQSLRIYQDLYSTHIGADLSEAALRVAASKFPHSQWVRTDATQLPFADASFDVVAFSSVLHHIPDYTAAIKEAARVLRPGGRVFAFDPNLLHPAMLFFRWPKNPFYISAGVSPNERPLLARDLRQAFQEAGFQDVMARGQSNIPYRRVAPRLLNLLLTLHNVADWYLQYSGLGRWFGIFVVTTAQKPGSVMNKKNGLRYSVVVPVFNEGENIGEYCRKAIQYLPPDYELLICYDMPADNTLPALAALPAESKPPNIRLVHNTLGRGVRYAIEAGMRAAVADVVVVMMADISDDFPKVQQMIEQAENGADVVCASRYMRGGKQIGGPKFKGFLSRMAGVSLYWLAGLPTHDPTNSFKAYRKDFLDRTPIQSTAGFCLGLELTVKAHFAGGLVEEVPATWLDRSAGQSRFKLMKWLPHYLHWYFWALRQRWFGKIAVPQ